MIITSGIPKQEFGNEMNGPHVELGWEAVPGADSYKIERSDEPYAGFGYLDSSSTNSFTHNDVVFNPKSFYRIITVDNDLILYWRDLSGNRLE